VAFSQKKGIVVAACSGRDPTQALRGHGLPTGRTQLRDLRRRLRRFCHAVGV